MDFFTNWWTGMDIMQKILACAAIPATVILILQTIMLMFGLGFGGDGDASGTESGDIGDAGHGGDTGELDGHYDGHVHDTGHADDHGLEGLRLFTVRGIVAFFAVGGWIGIAMVDFGIYAPLAGIIALAAGFLSLLAVSLMLKWSMKLQEDGTVNINGAIGRTAEVYTTIPPKMSGQGKVLVGFNERYMELAAVTKEDTSFKSAQMVKVLDVLEDSVLLISSMDSAE